MTTRTLSPKEEKIFQMFSKLKPELVETSQVSLGASSDMYTLVEPVVYRIPNTNYHLFFGDIRKSMSISQMKEWLERQIKSKTDTDANERVIDGEDEESPCGENCSHAHHQETAEEVNEEKKQINEEDINLIMDQCKVTREEALEAMKSSGYDVVNALVELGKNK